MMGGGVLGCLLAHISRLVPGARCCVVSLLLLSHYARFNYYPLLTSQRQPPGTYCRGHSLESATPGRPAA